MNTRLIWFLYYMKWHGCCWYYKDVKMKQNTKHDLKQGIVITIICFLIILFSFDERKNPSIDISKFDFSFHTQLFAMENIPIVFPLFKQSIKNLVPDSTLQFNIQGNNNEHISIDTHSGYITVGDGVPFGVYPLIINIRHKTNKYHAKDKKIQTTIFVLSDKNIQEKNTPQTKTKQSNNLGNYVFSYNAKNTQALSPRTPMLFDIISNTLPTDAVFYSIQNKVGDALQPWVSIDSETGVVRIDESASAGEYHYNVLSYSKNNAFGGIATTDIAIMLTDDLKHAEVSYNFYKAYYGLKNYLKITSPIKHIKGLSYGIADEKSDKKNTMLSKGISINEQTGTISIPDDLLLGTYAFNITIENKSSAVYSGSTIIPMKIDIVETNLVNLPFEYGDNEIVTAPVKTSFGIAKSKLPKHGIQYSIASSVKGIHINEKTGDISLSDRVPVGYYTFSVTASSKEKEMVGVKNVFVSLHVVDVFSYKSNVSAQAGEVFSMSDIDNPFLFVLQDLDIQKSAYTATVSIRNTNTNVLYYRQEKPVLLNRDSAGNIGVGISASYEDWRNMKQSETISLYIQLYKNSMPYYTYHKNVKIGNDTHIYSWRDLQAMDKDLSKDYIIMNDIDFPTPGTYGFSKKGFAPLGGKSMRLTKNFSGSLDGNHKSINNLYIDRDKHTAVGLFGSILIDNSKVNAKTIIKDITFNNINITGGKKTGGVFGTLVLLFDSKVKNKRYKIKNIHIASGVVSGENMVGGIAGYIDGSYFDFVNITNSGNVIARDKNVSYLGGLVGKLVGAYSSYNDTRSILKGYMEGNVIGYSDVGGLIGHADAADVAGYMIGEIVIQAGDFGGENIGGLVGKMGTRTESGILKGYMSGIFQLDPTTRGTKIGGLVGHASGGNIIGYTTSDIKGGDNSLIGGLVGIAQRLNDTDSIVGYATGTYKSKDGYAGAIYARSFMRVIGYWDAESNTIIGQAGNIYNYNNKINSIDEVIYNVASDTYLIGDTKIFDDDVFMASFDLPEEGGKWPLLKNFDNGTGEKLAQHIDTKTDAIENEKAKQYQQQPYNNINIAKNKPKEKKNTIQFLADIE